MARKFRDMGGEAYVEAQAVRASNGVLSFLKAAISRLWPGCLGHSRGYRGSR
jgi:hypothetical protein